MSAQRSRKQNKEYDLHRSTLKPNDCTFCAITSKDYQYVEGTSNFKVIRNIFPYSLWDDQEVEDHLMILPKKHTDTLADVSPNEAAEFLKLLSDYEQKGYSVYARAPDSVMKSVVHQHTHLIKTNSKRVRFMLVLQRPYFRIRF